MAVNAFRKSFSTWPACLAATKNRIFRKLKSVWPKFYSFDPKMVLHFHFTFKPFPGHAQKRERAREREREREKERRESREPLLMNDHATRKAELVEIVQSFDRRDRPLRSPRSPRNWWLPLFLQSFNLYLLFRRNWWLRSLRFKEDGSLGYGLWVGGGGDRWCGSLGCGLWPVVWVFIRLWWVCW